MVRNKNFYKAEINRNPNNAFLLAEEIIKKYGKKPYQTAKNGHKIISIEPVSNNWNGSIESFEIVKRKVCVNFYWQGDSTDGVYSEYLDKCQFGHRIPAEYWDDGCRTRCTHSDVNFTRDQIIEAITRML